MLGFLKILEEFLIKIPTMYLSMILNTCWHVWFSLENDKPFCSFLEIAYLADLFPMNDKMSFMA